MRHDDPSKVPEPKLLLGGALVLFYERTADGRLRARALFEPDGYLSSEWDVLVALVQALAAEYEVR